MARARSITRPLPYPKRIWIDPAIDRDARTYPFCLPLLADGTFEMRFDAVVMATARSPVPSRPAGF